MMSNGRLDPDELLSAYHDGELSAADRDVAARLLEESADARAELEDYRFLSETLRGLPAGRAPEGLRAAVMWRIERETLLPAVPQPVEKPSGSRRLRRAMYLIAGGLTAAAGLLLAFNLFDGRFGNDPVGGRPVAMDAPAEAAPEFAPALAAGSEAEFDRAARGVRDEAVGGAMPAEQPAERSEGSFGLEIAAAGPEARPPADSQIGDIYRYLEQTEEGIVVVEATVVDVREALDQMQVLLHRNSIPTVPANFGDEAETAAAPAASSGRDLAIYVESEPAQMNAALVAFSKEPVFLAFEVRGVLEAPRANADPAGETTRAASGFAGAGVEAKSAQSRSRFSVPEVRLGKEGTPAPASEVAQERTLAAEPSAAPETPLAEVDSASPADRPTTFDFDSGYQQVVPVPRELERQLRETRLTEQSGEEARQFDFYYSGPAVESLGVRGGRLEEIEPEQRNQQDEKLVRQRLGQLGQQAERRHRLLVVLERQPDVTKAEANASGKPPVEAPRPTRKKG